MTGLKLIVGLGNPTPRYEKTRHNAGFWFVDRVSRDLGFALSDDSRFHGVVGRGEFQGRPILLLKPMTYMNRSGVSVASIRSYFKIGPEEILVAHDELDLPAGMVRLKKGGGHGGHNGLRDIIAHLGGAEFYRLRFGVGHPGNKWEVTDYVLGTPSKSEEASLDSAMVDALAELPWMLRGEFSAVMNRLNSNADKASKKTVDGK